MKKNALFIEEYCRLPRKDKNAQEGKARPPLKQIYCGITWHMTNANIPAAQCHCTGAPFSSMQYHSCSFMFLIYG
uniref:Uncharacterized protein n=1 Tax=Romanomermis culicivorax TaxID=13658 RepID=A0A915KBQ0_ROMCU